MHYAQKCRKWEHSSIFMLFLDLLQNDAIMTSRCMHFIVEGESLKSTTRVSYLWQKEKGRERELGPSTPGWKMDERTCVRFTLKQPVRVANSISHFCSIVFCAIQKLLFLVCFVPAFIISPSVFASSLGCKFGVHFYPRADSPFPISLFPSFLFRIAPSLW